MAGDFIPDIHHQEYPEFGIRRALMLRAMIALHLEILPYQKTTNLQSVADAARGYGKEIFHLDKPSMDDAVRGMLGRAHQSAQTSKLAKAGRYIQGLSNQANKLACGHCTKNSSCTGKPVADAAVVASPNSGKTCMSYVIETFLKLVDYAGKYYNDLTSLSGKLTIRLTATHTIEDLLSGQTEVMSGDRSDDRRANVRIILPVDHFNENHLSALPYILFHEIFVHTPEAWTTKGPRIATPEYCEFREGFVDTAAAYLLQKGLQSKSLSFDFFPGLNPHLAVRTERNQTMRASICASASLGSTALDSQISLAARRERGLRIFKQYADDGHAQMAVALAAAVNLMEADLARRALYLKLIEDAHRHIAADDDTEVGTDAHAFAVCLQQQTRDPINIQKLQGLFEDRLKSRGCKEACPDPVDDLDF
jgi:hypothetical protein